MIEFTQVWYQRIGAWLKNVGQAYNNLPKAFQLVWVASPGGTLIMAGLALVGGLLPPLLAWVTKLIIDQVVALTTSGVDPWVGVRLMLPLLALEFFLLIVSIGSGQLRSLIERYLGAKLSLHINQLIINKTQTLDVSYFENAAYYDLLQNVRQETNQRTLDIIVQSLGLIQNAITLLAFIFLLIRFSPWLLLIIGGATLPSFAAQNKYGRLTFRLLNDQAPERRQMQYYEELLTVDRYVNEVKLFGLSQLVLRRYIDLFQQLFREDITLARKRSLISIGWGSLGLLSYYSTACWIVFRAIAGIITFGDAVLYLEVFRQTHHLLQNILNNLLSLYENSLFVNNISNYLALTPQITSPASPIPMPLTMQQGLEFRDVSFRYPGQTNWALRHINLTLHPGEKLALVGLNGAGKTTLVKLITRLYDPTEGQILLDGCPLDRYDLIEWRQKIGVIFQDFVRYHLTAAENVGIGQIANLDDQVRIVAAAKKGGADEFLADLPKGYGTMLGKWFEAGHELSIGQWQKVALSRAFMRDAEILILDEPTAALDAAQEYRIFQQFRQLTEGKMAILISHRFSTVRMADRIAVIEAGQVTEIGSHNELMAQNSTYAHLFNIQAQGYR